MHDPWLGKEYETGIGGQRIAIIGYSRWNGEAGGVDSPSFTNTVLRAVVSGAERHNFFDHIRNYFGLSDHEEFWSRVIFFNYLPECIGGPDSRFGRGSDEQNERANERFLGLLGRYVPQKTVIFSSKTWGALPPFRKTLRFRPDGLEKAVLKDPCGTYESNGHTVAAFGLRHPQGAPKEQMCEAVRRIIEFDIR